MYNSVLSNNFERDLKEMRMQAKSCMNRIRGMMDSGKATYRGKRKHHRIISNARKDASPLRYVYNIWGLCRIQ